MPRLLIVHKPMLHSDPGPHHRRKQPEKRLSRVKTAAAFFTLPQETLGNPANTRWFRIR